MSFGGVDGGVGGVDDPAYRGVYSSTQTSLSGSPKSS